MLSRLFGRTRAARTAPALYDAIVTQARRPALYADLSVPDTVSGRFEMVVLHVFLVLHRLKDGGPEDNAAGQSLFDLFCTEMDRSLRELGVGDLGVSKKMRQVGEAFYGRTKVYDDAIGRRDEATLADALARNIFKDGGRTGAAAPLARYVLAVVAGLAAVPPAALVAGEPPFADPAAFAAKSGALA